MLNFIIHKKISLRKHPQFNEAWLHDRICDDPTILGLGDVRVLDRERTMTSGGRLDILLLDEDNNRRYEVEIMLGPTDPSHIIRGIEYWDIERKRYPGYDHIAVLIAENVTTRFLNVMNLFAGSIPLIAIQLDALQVNDNILLNFVRVLDQIDLRIDDTDIDSGGGDADRNYWKNKVGDKLLSICDKMLEIINAATHSHKELNYLKGYIGLLSNGIARNFIYFAPKRTMNIVHIYFKISNAGIWKDKFEQVAANVRSKRSDRYRVSVTPDEFSKYETLLRDAVIASVREFES